MYDIIIIGSGPAGLTAGIYSTRREMKTLIIGKELGGQLALASDIENYPAFESISNYELIERIRKQVSSFGAEIVHEEVIEINKESDKTFSIITNKQAYKAKTVLVAMGLQPRKLNIPGETELSGRGVSFCANCDGPFYKDKIVAVIGGGNSAFDSAEIMSKIAKQVYLINRSEEFKAFDVLVNEVKNRDNIKIILNAETREIIGQGKVEGLKYFNYDNQNEEELKVDGVFIEIGRIANTDLLADLVERNNFNQIIANSDMSTKTPGLFVAGDVVESEFKQITIAMGFATTAALSAYQYLQMNSKLL